ncbi:MAG: type IV secretory system conjugative DNA transfer family protein [Actinomycetota bacterium]|nr:type IV secretory system conjugative DNA transfer family protein [Actinomycetota bacterium]
MPDERLVLGRRTLRGLPWGLRVCLDRGHSLLVVGATQSGKTSSLVVPAILTWPGPVVVTSVKYDVVTATEKWRASLGHVQRLEPGRDDGLTWDPLEAMGGLRHALRVARSLTSESARAEGEFWNSLAVKLLAALFVAAQQRGRTIFDVAEAVESRRWSEWISCGASSSHDVILRSFLEYDPKTLDGVVTTAETMLLPWRFRQPIARIRDVGDGPHTLYLCSARGEQQSYEPLFRGALRSVVEGQQVRHNAHRALPLLLVLDEAATVASLDELDQLAATVSGLGVTLVTVVQDFAQLVARWGPRAATIVNNHATRMVLAGLADPTVGTYLPEIVESRDERPVVPLRMRPRNTAVVVAGRRAVLTVRLRPWWRQRRLRARGERRSSVLWSNGGTGRQS